MLEQLGIFAVTQAVLSWLKLNIVYRAMDNTIICVLTIVLTFIVGWWAFKHVRLWVNRYGFRVYAFLYAVTVFAMWRAI